MPPSTLVWSMYWMLDFAVALEEQHERILAGQAGAVQLERVEVPILRSAHDRQGPSYIKYAEVCVFCECGGGEHGEHQHRKQKRKHSSFHAASSIVIN